MTLLSVPLSPALRMPHDHTGARWWGSVWLFLCLFWLATSAMAARLPAEWTGKVVGVQDGDTITVLDGRSRTHKIRLLGIDAPERKQAFGERSRARMATLVFGQTVRVDGGKLDRYGRVLARIWIDGQDVSLEQIRAGLAWHYKQYQRQQSPTDRIAYAEAEEQARRDRLGLWSDPRPIPPWEFRRQRRAPSQ